MTQKRLKPNRQEKKNKDNISALDDFSLLWNTIDLVDISKSKTNNEYYHYYMGQYKKDNFNFKLNRFYGFNFPALFLGPIYYMYSGLYVGLFIVLLLNLMITQLLFNISPLIFKFIPMFLIGNIIGAFLANYFVLLKSVYNFNQSLKYTKDKQLLIQYTENLNTKKKWLNIIISIPYSIFLFYLLLFINHPSYFLSPVESLQQINKEISVISTVPQKNSNQ